MIDYKARTAKALETKAQQAAEYAEQTITIDANWRTIRADELNWEIQYKGAFKGYYGTVSSALKALPAKMLSESAKGSLSDVLRMQEAILATIQKALP